MKAKARVQKLEQKRGGGDTVIIVAHIENDSEPDENQTVTVNGERMTLAEARRRWPDAERHVFHVRYNGA